MSMEAMLMELLEKALEKPLQYLQDSELPSSRATYSWLTRTGADLLDKIGIDCQGDCAGMFLRLLNDAGLGQMPDISSMPRIYSKYQNQPPVEPDNTPSAPMWNMTEQAAADSFSDDEGFQQQPSSERYVESDNTPSAPIWNATLDPNDSVSSQPSWLPSPSSEPQPEYTDMTDTSQPGWSVYDDTDSYSGQPGLSQPQPEYIDTDVTNPGWLPETESETLDTPIQWQPDDSMMEPVNQTSTITSPEVSTNYATAPDWQSVDNEGTEQELPVMPERVLPYEDNSPITYPKLSRSESLKNLAQNRLRSFNRRQSENVMDNPMPDAPLLLPEPTPTNIGGGESQKFDPNNLDEFLQQWKNMTGGSFSQFLETHLHRRNDTASQGIKKVRRPRRQTRRR